MVESEVINRAKEIAAAHFKEKANCAESVFMAVREVGLLDCPPGLVALATGFGGGLGLAGHACGALLGAVMAVSGVYGRKNPLEGNTPEERLQKLHGKDGLYRLFNSLPHEFVAQMGAPNCRELCAPYEWQSKERSLNCKKAVQTGAELAVKHILLGQEGGFARPFGSNMAGLK